MKSQAVKAEGWGIPGVSGELKLCLPPISGGFAKLPGVVPCPNIEGLLPKLGSAILAFLELARFVSGIGANDATTRAL